MIRTLPRPQGEGNVIEAKQNITLPYGEVVTLYTYRDLSTLRMGRARDIPLFFKDGEPVYMFFRTFTTGTETLYFKEYAPLDTKDPAVMEEFRFQLQMRMEAEHRPYLDSANPNDYALTKRRGIVLRRVPTVRVPLVHPAWVGALRNRDAMYSQRLAVIQAHLAGKPTGYAPRCTYDLRKYFVSSVPSDDEKLTRASQALNIAMLTLVLFDCTWYGLNGTYVDTYETRAGLSYTVFPFPPGIKLRKWRYLRPDCNTAENRTEQLVFLLIFCWFYCARYSVSEAQVKHAVVLKPGFFFMEFEEFFQRSRYSAGTLDYTPAVTTRIGQSFLAMATTLLGQNFLNAAQTEAFDTRITSVWPVLAIGANRQLEFLITLIDIIAPLWNRKDITVRFLRYVNNVNYANMDEVIQAFNETYSWQT